MYHHHTAGPTRPASQTKTTRAGGTSHQLTQKMKRRNAQRRKKEKQRRALLLHQQRSVLRPPKPVPAPLAETEEAPASPPLLAQRTFPIRRRRAGG